LTPPPPSGEGSSKGTQIYVAAIWAVSMVAAMPVAVLFFYPNEWSLGRRLLAGVLLGVGTGLILTANRLIGKSESI